jgi:hypothetical protein
MRVSVFAARRCVLPVAALAGVLALAQPARASESGASFYLLGSGGPEAAIPPPLQGVFLGNTVYYYRGESRGNRPLILNGNIAAGIDGTIAADFPAVLWVPSTNILGGTLSAGAMLPFGQVWASASALLSGPRGNQFGVSRGDTAFVIGDPVLTASMAWKLGNTYVQLSDLLNIPVGEYREDALANLAFHRVADDRSVAASWHEPKSGWDVSGKTGFTFNGVNGATDYRTGTEWHLEGAVEKQLTPAWALGVQAYYFNQVTGDSGSGAKLGPFLGRVTGVGGEAAYNFKIMGKIPASFRLHGTTEFDVQNRLQGHSIWLDFAMPLQVKLPAAAGS